MLRECSRGSRELLRQCSNVKDECHNVRRSGDGCICERISIRQSVVYMVILCSVYIIVVFRRTGGPEEGAA